MMSSYLKSIEYASYLLWKKHRPPFYLIHFVTEQCPANCRHCFVNAGPDDGKSLRLDEIEMFARKIKRMLFVFLTGGEPFIRDDLAGIARAYSHYAGVQKIQCPSNGYYPEKMVDIVRDICSSCPDTHFSVTLSIDAVGVKHDESRRCPGLFERVIRAFHLLQEEEKKFSNFNLNVTTTVSSFNQDELERLHDFVINELKCGNYFNTLVRGKPREPAAANVDISKFEAFNDVLEVSLRSAKMRGYRRFPFADFINAKNIISRRLITRTAKENTYQIPCYAGQIAGVLYSKGDVYPCELLPEKLGNIRDVDYDLSRIWESDRAANIRKKIFEEKCFCTHECFTTLNILFNPRFLSKLVREVLRLKINRILRN
ncbi:radical SAM protein [bacterium]|nr:radical SAM protein [candidate division CSSED10-310 bacterium]